ncbi:hypothetical protein L596_012241 [Steinernema carpocapsae]|uniref:Histone deacetylase domain-containing protein n=1 Tax=Steinernema carpocapsae TaxID=34508 RepID=A0A4U5NXC1_STECR|nr:hypothetical protein L596_012241 [Steinernema carpocapsae]
MFSFFLQCRVPKESLSKSLAHSILYEMAAKFAFVYDERMLEHECLYDGTMEECPERTKKVYERLKKEGLLEDAVQITAGIATKAEINLGHPEELIEELENLKTVEQCEEYCRSKDFLWLHPESLKAARLALGGTIDCVRANLEGLVGNCFAIVRPPGHHSYGIHAQGYCVFNNVAIAAKYAVEKLGLERVMIVDFDLHVGNGTYEIVKDDDRILFVSSHLYNHGSYWPYYKEFDCDPFGNNIFIPFNCAMNSESDLLAAYNNVVMPIAKEFQPELILISAGFDSGYYDVMLELGQGIKAPGYGYIARMLNDLCPEKVIAVFEGGYFWKNYTESAVMLTRGLRGMSLPKIYHPERVNGSMSEVIWDNLCHQAKKWNSAKEQLEKLQKQQIALGLSPYVPRSPKLFLAFGFREHLDFVRDSGCLKTREWFPKLTKEQEEFAARKIDDYIKAYEHSNDLVMPDPDNLLKQLIWDEQTAADCYIRNAKVCVQSYEGFTNYLKSNDGVFECFDKKLMK